MSISPSPSKSVRISSLDMSSKVVKGPANIPDTTFQCVQCPELSMTNIDSFPLLKKSPTWTNSNVAGKPVVPFWSTTSTTGEERPELVLSQE